MHRPIALNTATSAVLRLIDPSPWRRGFPVVFLTLALACFALSSTARAVLPPPVPDGGYSGNNTAEGDRALSSVQINTSTGTGIGNTATGFSALASNTIGGANTATGASALKGNTIGSRNTAIGGQALFFNKSGTDNTASGVGALSFNIAGNFNTATGVLALEVNTNGSGNTATGAS